MNNVIKTDLGNCVVEYKRSDFAEEAAKYRKFAIAPQFAPELIIEYSDKPVLFIGRVLYGVTRAGELVWLGQIIDSSD